MRSVAKSSPMHSEARRKLLAFMSSLSAKGETSLPGERALCEELGVSRLTVRRVLKRLESEGCLNVVPNKGAFIVKGVKRPTIGVVTGSEEDLTFLRSPAMLEGALSVLQPTSCCLRLLQVPSPDRLSSMVEDYRLDGCLWIMPKPSLFKKIDVVEKELGIPVVSVVSGWADTQETELPAHSVATDLDGKGEARAALLLGRGLRRIARFNSDSMERRADGGEERAAFMRALARAGFPFDVAREVARADGMREKIAALAGSGAVDGAAVNGGSEAMRAVFETLSSCKGGASLELVLDFTGCETELLAEFPQVKVAGAFKWDERGMGALASGELLASLRERRSPRKMKAGLQALTREDLLAKREGGVR